MQRPGTHADKLRGESVAAIGSDDPARPRRVPFQVGDLGMEQRVVVQPVLRTDAPAMRENFLMMKEQIGGSRKTKFPGRTCAPRVMPCDEIAGIVMKSLRAIDGCPNRGFVVTVYGSNPWNAMLTIRPEAGPRIDRELWRSRVHDIGVQLRNDFDVANTSTISTGGST